MNATVAVPFMHVTPQGLLSRSIEAGDMSDNAADRVMWAASKAGLDLYSSMLLIRMAYGSDKWGNVGAVSRQELGDLIGASPRRAFDAAQLLESLGLISIDHTRAECGRGPTTRNVYRLNLQVAETQFAARIAERAEREAADATRAAMPVTGGQAQTTTRLASTATASHRPFSPGLLLPANRVASSAAPVCLVCLYIKTKQLGCMDQAMVDHLLIRLRNEARLTRSQIEEAAGNHDPRHLQAVLDHVAKYYRAGTVGEGKEAPYFLVTLRDATHEGLPLSPSAVDVGTTCTSNVVTPAEPLEAKVEAEKVRDAKRKEKAEENAAWEAEWETLDASCQAAMMAAFLKDAAETNSIVYHGMLKHSSLDHRPTRMLFIEWCLDNQRTPLAPRGTDGGADG